MRKLPFMLLIALLAVSGIAAQQAINYVIRSISTRINADQVEVDFDVSNQGAAMTVTETARLFSSSGEVLAQQPVQPLDAGQRVSLSLSAPLSKFPPGTSQRLYAAVALEQLPPESQRQLFGNIGVVTVLIPAQVAATASAPGTGGASPRGFLSVDWNNPSDRALVVGIIGVVTVLLWVITVILRLLFTRPPIFMAWQPPYVITPLVDPNSTNGRRQLWQQHATSDTLPAPCVPGTYMVRKLLIGNNGVKLGGWRVTGMRISQYDRYGRVARSQTVADKGTVKALDKAVRKSPSMDAKRAERAARPIARRLIGVLMKKSTRQNAILPVALDIRIVGMHGEVRILFELFGCSAGNWEEIDHWEPEMRVVNGSIQENFTYTLVGAQSGETSNAYRQRLQDDLTHLLAGMVLAPPAVSPLADTAEVQAVQE